MRIANVLFLALAAAMANASAANSPYNCSKYKSKYAKTNCAEFETAYNECLSGKLKLNITCADLQKNDIKWLAKNDIAANDKLATSGSAGEREHMAAQWADTISRNYYRHVKSKVLKMKNGYAIYAVHPFFTQYQFSIGNDTDLASSFIHQNSADMTKLTIVRIGVQNDRGESAWFDLK